MYQPGGRPAPGMIRDENGADQPASGNLAGTDGSVRQLCGGICAPEIGQVNWRRTLGVSLRSRPG